jgi:dextranase
VIIAAYIDPARIHNVRLADAIILASGGYHLELGEPGAMLADPYFPRFGQMDEATQAIMQRYYDFLVRYEEVLSLDTTDATGSHAKALTIPGVETQKLRSRDKVAVIVRQGPGFETFSLINLMGIDGGRWDVALAAGPDALTDLPVRIHTARPVVRAWLASPDGESLDAQPVALVTGEDDAGPYVSFELPRLDYWTMIVLEYRP